MKEETAYYLFCVFLFALLLFCAYVAFAQWRLTKDPSIPWYICYLLAAFVHYFRGAWIEGAKLPDMNISIPPDPPFRWDAPSSYLIRAAYIFFIWHIMEVKTKMPKWLSFLFVGMGAYHLAMIGANLLMQWTWGLDNARSVYHNERGLLFLVMAGVMIHLILHAKVFYQKLVLFGTLALLVGSMSTVVTGFFTKTKEVIGIFRCFKTIYWGSICLPDMKLGVVVDIICFSWALTLRTKILLQSEVMRQSVPLPRPEPVSVVSPDFRPDDEFLAKIHAFLSQNFGDENLRVKQLAKAIHLTVDQTNRRMKERTKLTTEQFVLLYRLEASKKLLLTTDKGVSQIASDTGFKELAYFSNSFKKQFGLSPSQFRQKNADKTQKSAE